MAEAPPEAPALVPVQKRVIIWDEVGMPHLAVQPALTVAHLKSLYSIVAAQPYVPDPLDPNDAQYAGMTVAEVLVRKQIEAAAKSGDMGMIETVMDRLIGKPKSSSESVNLNLSGNYEEFLKRKAAEIAAGAAAIPGETVNDENVFGDLA